MNRSVLKGNRKFYHVRMEGDPSFWRTLVDDV